MVPRYPVSIILPVLITGCIACVGVGVAETLPEPLFRASFEKSADGWAGTSRIVGKPAGRQSAPLVLERGLMGTALATGRSETQAPVRYDVAAFWPQERGTLLFWIRAEDLTVTWESGFRWFSLSGSDGWARFYKPGRHPWFGLLSRTKAPEADKTADSYLFFPGAATYDSDWNVWHQIALTWIERTARLYLDGVMMAETAGFTFPENIGTLELGNEKDANFRFDEVALYGRPLLAAELRRLWQTTLRPLTSQRVTIPLVRKAPVIDGKIEPAEWDQATVITGLTRGDPLGDPADGCAADDRSRFSLQYDDVNLYLACISPWPAEVKDSPHLTAGMTGLLKTRGTVRDADLANDDHFGLMLMPAWPNGPCYRLRVNGDGIMEDGMFEMAGNPVSDQASRAWNGDWEAKSTLAEEAWTVELRIPLAQFGDHVPDAVWGLNLVRAWRALKPDTNAWAWGRCWMRRPASDPMGKTGDAVAPAGNDKERWADVAVSMAEMVFGTEESPVVRLSDFSLDAQHRSHVGAEIRGGSRQTRRQRAEVSLTTSSGAENQTEGLDLLPGTPVTFNREFEIRNAGTAALSFSVDQGKQTVYRAELRFLYEQKMELLTWNYPSRDLLRVKLEASLLAEIPAAGLAAELELRPLVESGVGSPAAVRESLTAFPSHQPEFVVSTKPLALGKYEIVVTVRQGTRTIAELRQPFEKKALPEWLGNQIGISDNVPPPFTPLRVKDDQIAAWGREVDYGQGLFPARIRSQGFELLQRPIRIVVTDAQGETYRSDAAPAAGSWQKQTDPRVEGERHLTVDRFRFENRFWMEYDGLCWSRLTVSSSAPEPISRLVLEIPLKPEFGDVVNFGDYGLARTGKLPAEGILAPFSEMVWVGNAYAGIMWVCDSQANWHLVDPKKREAIQIVPAADEVILRLTFVNTPTALDQPLPLEFGLMVTPVKDRVPDYRRWSAGTAKLGWGYAFYPRHEAMTPGAEGWYSQTFIQERPPESTARTWNASTANRHLQRKYTGPYVAAERLNCRVEYFEDFFGEWVPEADARYVADPTGGHDAMGVSTAADSYQDFFVWRYWKLMQKTPFAALYYDCSGNRGGVNPHAGIGVRDRAGNLVPEFGSLGLRQITKRLYTMIKERYPDGIIKYHHSGRPNLTFMAFAESSVDGENTFSRLSPGKRDYRGTMRPDVFRAEYMGHNLGFLTEFLPQFTRSGLWTRDEVNRKENLPATDHIVGLVLLHDSYLWSSYVSGLAWERAGKALRQHDFSDVYKMIPYWDQQVAVLPENLFASFFIKPTAAAPPSTALDSAGRYYAAVAGPADTIIAIFCNESDWEGTLAIPVNWQKLGVSNPENVTVENAVHSQTLPLRIQDGVTTKETDPLKVRDYEREFTRDPGEFARIENGNLTFPITAYNYRMIVFQAPQSGPVPAVE